MPCLPLGIAHSLPPMPDGDDRHPGPGRHEGGALEEGLYGRPGLAGALREEHHRLTAAQGRLAAAQGLAVRGAAMHREGARAS